MNSLRDLLDHVVNDHQGGVGDYHRLAVVDQGDRGYDVVLRIDGGYSHPADADAARAYWQRVLDAGLAALEGERAA